MATRVKDLNTKYADDLTELAQTIAWKVGYSTEFDVDQWNKGASVSQFLMAVEVFSGSQAHSC